MRPVPRSCWASSSDAASVIFFSSVFDRPMAPGSLPPCPGSINTVHLAFAVEAAFRFAGLFTTTGAGLAFGCGAAGVVEERLWPRPQTRLALALAPRSRP